MKQEQAEQAVEARVAEQRDKRKARLLLQVLDRHIHEHYRNPSGLDAGEKDTLEVLLEMHAELTQVAHRSASVLSVLSGVAGVTAAGVTDVADATKEQSNRMAEPGSEFTKEPRRSRR